MLACDRLARQADGALPVALGVGEQGLGTNVTISAAWLPLAAASAIASATGPAAAYASPLMSNPLADSDSSPAHRLACRARPARPRIHPAGPARISAAPAVFSRWTASRAASGSSRGRSANSQLTGCVASRLDSVAKAPAVAASATAGHRR